MSGQTHVLVYRCGTLGDTLVALPAMAALRRRFPGARFTLLTAHEADGALWTDDVLRDFNWFDGSLTYERRELRHPVRLWGVVRRVRAQRPDLVVYLADPRHGRLRIWRDRLFFALAGARRFWCTPSAKVTPFGRPRRGDRVYPRESERLLGALARYGVGNGRLEFEVPAPAGAGKAVAALLDGGGLEAGRPLVALCPGAKLAIKCWPLDRFAEVGRRLIEAGGVNVAIVGGPAEAAAGARIGAGWSPGRWLNAANRLGVLESAELLRRCLFYVGNDTGAMHLAAAVGTRCVAVFSARDAARSWHPAGDNHIVLRRDVACRHCRRHVCATEPPRCLTEIGVEDVWGACRRMLAYH